MNAMNHDLSRRAALTMAATAGLAVAGAGTAEGRDLHRNGRVRLHLPPPRAPIGTTELHLRDRSRRDPWTGSTRELMVSLWYPAAGDCGFPRAPWLPPATAALYRQQTAQVLRTSIDTVDFPITHGHRNAPVRRGRLPVLLYSPGYSALRGFGTSLVEDLAARGYLVITVDHTHEATMVEFPGGRLELGKTPPQPSDEQFAEILQVRQADISFVLDELRILNSGRNPDAEQRRLPRGFGGALDLRRIGMFGHSLGGDTAAEVMGLDRRVRAGADLDGSINGPVATAGLDAPFLLMSSAEHNRDNDPSWAQFWSHLRGWRQDLRLLGSGHEAYTDLSPLIQQLVRALSLPPDVVASLTEEIGTIAAGTTIATERAYLGAFFDLHLRRGDGRLLAGPSPRFPEIEFVP